MGFVDLVVKRKEYLNKLEESVQKIVEVLSCLPEIERIILFGSYARGRKDLLTDLDVLVVMETELDPLARTAFIYERLFLPVDCDILVYTPVELERMKEQPFLRQILKEGKVLYEKRSQR
ncbi:MAG: nucleotidyltransferase domain-containing protein [Atribacterota bacterium]|nr:nucleotidyltransferase domain-containing protein [Atribacterota bacterium]